MRVILSAHYLTHSRDLLKELNFMSINDRITYLCGCFVFRALNGLIPPSTLRQSLHQLAVDTSTQQDQVQMVISKHANFLQTMVNQLSGTKGCDMECNLPKYKENSVFKKSLKDEFISYTPVHLVESVENCGLCTRRYLARRSYANVMHRELAITRALRYDVSARD